MAIKLPERSYFTFAEIAVRWQCNENDIRGLILRGLLVPSIRINGPIVPFMWERDPTDGWCFTATTLDQNGEEIFEWANGFFYLQDFAERAPFEGDSFVLSRERKYSFFEDGAYLIRTPSDKDGRTFSMSEVIQTGVVTMEELAHVEKTLTDPPGDAPIATDKTLTTKERNTLLTIIGVLAKVAGLDIAATSKSADVIVNEAALSGISLSRTGVANHLRAVPEAMGTRIR